jgi:hypothetical protein
MNTNIHHSGVGRYSPSPEFKSYSLWKDKTQRCSSIPLAPDRLYINTYLEDYDSKLFEPTVKQAHDLAIETRKVNIKKSRSSERKLFQRIAEMDVKATRVSKSSVNQHRHKSNEKLSARNQNEAEPAKMSRRPLKFENQTFYDKPYSARLKLSPNYASKSANDVNYVIQLDFDSASLNALIDSHGKDKHTVNSYLKYFRSKTAQDNFTGD